MTNEDLGYDSFFVQDKIKQGFSGYDVARVISENKESYITKNDKGEYFSKIRGKRIFNAESRYDFPVVGDWVVVTNLGSEQSVIEHILKRKTILSRRVEDRSSNNNIKDLQIISSNIDVAFIVQSVGRDYNLNRFERYILICENGGVEPVLVLNKTDLISIDNLNLLKQEIYNRFGGIKTLTINTVEDDGLSSMIDYFEKNKTYCFLGSSGVGKSSIIKKLIKDNNIKISDVGKFSNRGRHTTTERHMYFIDNGSILIDNPGIREVGVSGDLDNLEYFNDISVYKNLCKFSDCTHTHEPGCAVRKTVEEGDINKEKYDNYLKMKKETEYLDMSDFEKRKKDKNFGKMIKNVLKNKNDRNYY